MMALYHMHNYAVIYARNCACIIVSTKWLYFFCRIIVWKDWWIVFSQLVGLLSGLELGRKFLHHRSLFRSIVGQIYHTYNILNYCCCCMSTLCSHHLMLTAANMEGVCIGMHGKFVHSVLTYIINVSYTLFTWGLGLRTACLFWKPSRNL